MATKGIVLHHTQLARIDKILNFEGPQVIKRSNILKQLHCGMGIGFVAKLQNVTTQTVRNVRKKFLKSGLDAALYDAPRSGRPIEFDDRDKSHLVSLVCSKPPSGYCRWTLSLLGEELVKRCLIRKGSISREEVRIILKKNQLGPWRQKMWCIPKMTEEYIDRMKDILEVYERPYDESKPLVCLDEKPVVLHKDVRQPIEMKPK